MVRFTLNFIFHQILLFLTVSLPAVFYLTVLKQPMEPVIINLTTGLILAAYVLYCLFYGYYVARPMYEILLKIKRLSDGEYLAPVEKKRSLSGRLYREVYANLVSLSATLQENQRKRVEFEQLRQEWAAGITHDLKTPLSYISGYADMLLSEEHEWSEIERQQFLQLIKAKSAHMEELIHDLGLAFRMDQAGVVRLSAQKIQLAELVRRVVAETANMPAAKDNSFTFAGGEEPVYVTGDAALLQRAFSNLLVNAVVHNPPDTAIEVQIRQNTHAVVRITDHGQGMDEYSVSHLFDRYYRGTSTDAPAGGTGLGMAIVKQIVAAHQGTIDVDSQPGRGTLITVRLPQN